MDFITYVNVVVVNKVRVDICKRFPPFLKVQVIKYIPIYTLCVNMRKQVDHEPYRHNN